MAVFTLQHGMRAHQREAILVIANILQRHLPSLYRVATLTVSTELAAMDIGVAIRAVCAYFFEDQVGMATSARNLLVHPA